MEVTFRCRAAGGLARPADGEFLDVRWFPRAELPETDQHTNDLALVRLALDHDDAASFEFSGAAQILPADALTRHLHGG